MATFDTTALLAAVRREARAPSATATGWADSDLLALANREARQYLAPRLMRAREDFLVAVKDVALVAGTAAYALPSRAILGKVREVQLVGADGTVRDLDQGNPERLDGTDSTGSNGTPAFYFFRGNDVVLSPAPDASGFPTLRIHYFRRLNRLVAASECAVLDSAEAALELSGESPETFLVGGLLDVVGGTEPFPSRGDDLPISAVGDYNVTVTTQPTGAVAGDYVCLAGEAPVLQLPPEFFDLLVLRTAFALVASGTDTEARKDLAERLKEAEGNLFGALAGDRNEGEAEAIVNTSWS